MPEVRVTKRHIKVDSQSIPLISGEMHYWRLNPKSWPACLDAMREMGLSVVATYVPWYYHEYERGKFDFTGRTDNTRDLKGFLELAKRKKFWVIIRPGPYIYSESPNDGVPDYAYKYHRLHPKFLDYARTYLRKVSQIIKPFQATRRGGHIILLQADNEIDPWTDVFGKQYGFGKKRGLFQDFLSYKYNSDINLLNQVWESDFTSFHEVGPFVVHQLKGDSGLRRHLDFYEFKHFYSREVAQWTVGAYKECGITVPIYVNLYPFFYAHDWRTMEAAADMSGIDLYPENEFHVAHNDHRKFMDKVRYTRTYSSVPYIAEFASGVWHNHHYASGVLTPNHYMLITLSALAAGVCGWNWYMLVNRDNWYMSPINEWGRVRPELFTVFKNLVSVFNRIKPYNCEKVTDIAVTFNPLQYAAKTIPQDGNIMHALYDADIDYEFYDPRDRKCTKPILFYSGNHWLSQAAQDNLLSYVEKGGTLVCFQNYPRRDSFFKPYNALGLTDPSRTLFQFKKVCHVRFPNKRTVSVVSSIFGFHKVPGKAITAQIAEEGEFIVGYEKKIGKGRVIHLGLEQSSEILYALLSYCHIATPVVCRTKDVHTALLRRGKKYFLIVVNNGNEEKSARTFLHEKNIQKKKLCAQDVLTREKFFPQGKELSFNVEVDRKSGVVLELSIK